MFYFAISSLVIYVLIYNYLIYLIGVMNIIQYWIQDNLLMGNKDSRNCRKDLEIANSNRYDYTPILDVDINNSNNDDKDDDKDNII